jgi:hypothetical protein
MRDCFSKIAIDMAIFRFVARALMKASVLHGARSQLTSAIYEVEAISGGRFS